MVGAYVRMRQQQKRDEGSKKAFTHTSPRTLLGVLRLAQALARLRFADEVISEDVDEALRLTEVSKASLYADENRNEDHSPSSKIYHLIKAMEASGAAAVGDGTRGELDLRRVRERVLAKGFTANQFEAAIDEYTDLDVCVYPPSNFSILVLTPYRSGKPQEKVHDWSSSRLVTRTKTWMTRTFEQCDECLWWSSRIWRTAALWYSTVLGSVSSSAIERARVVTACVSEATQKMMPPTFLVTCVYDQ
jgi:hypothetical protein